MQSFITMVNSFSDRFINKAWFPREYSASVDREARVLGSFFANNKSVLNSVKIEVGIR